MTSKSKKQPQQQAQPPKQAAPKKDQPQGNERGGIAQRKPGPDDSTLSGGRPASKPGSGREGFGADEAQRRQRDHMTTDTSSAERGPDTNTNPSSAQRPDTDKRSSGPDQRSSGAGSRKSTESGQELDSPDIERHGGSGRDTMTPGGRDST